MKLKIGFLEKREILERIDILKLTECQYINIHLSIFILKMPRWFVTNSLRENLYIIRDKSIEEREINLLQETTGILMQEAKILGYNYNFYASMKLALMDIITITQISNKIKRNSIIINKIIR